MSALTDWIAQQDDMLRETVVAWSSINSGTSHVAGVQRMVNVIAESMQDLGEVSRIPLRPYQILGGTGELVDHPVAQALYCRIDNNAPFSVLLCGHCDTVFPEQHHFQSAELIDNDCLRGPGVTDMKSGILIMLTAVRALLQSPAAALLNIDIVINPDEETGSLSSYQFIESRAAHNDVALVFEPSITPSGNIVSHRKGNGKYTIIAKGKAAHAGRDFSKGRNAIVGLSALVAEIAALNQQREGVTLNIGLMHGGSALNTVPEQAECSIDIRTQQKNDEQWVCENIEAIIAQHQERNDIEFVFQGFFGRPPKTLTPELEVLLALVKDCGAQLGQRIDWQPSGGCCDGNNLAAKGLPVVDSLGGRGDFIHTDQEYLILPSLVERAQLSGLLLTTLAQDKQWQDKLKGNV